MSVRDEFNRAGPVIDGLNAAIRENPLAAGLIGVGVAWMLFGGAKGFGGMAGTAKGAARTVGSTASAAGTSVAGSVAKAGWNAVSGLKEAATSIAETVAPIVPDLSTPDVEKALEASSEVKAAIGDRITSAATAGREYGAAMQSKLSEGLERQPLLLGVIGLAIGAGIASTFATTALEGEFMGKKGAAAHETLQGLFADIKDRALEVASDVRDEAQRQGLTVDAAKVAAAGIGEKVKIVASAGQESVTQRLN